MTLAGGLISGPGDVGSCTEFEAHVSQCVSACNADSLLRKFWKDEEISQKLPLNEEDERCEQYFVSTHSRTGGGGRYTMRLPFKAGSPIDIGDSLQIATALYARMEGKLQSRPEISQPYHDFLREYLEQGHMKPVTEKVTPAFEPVYIPHHAMIRESSSTTKLRVVFNASCRTRNGTSLNDHLLVGPKLQQDLPIVYSVIVARWRQCL